MCRAYAHANIGKNFWLHGSMVFMGRPVGDQGGSMGPYIMVILLTLQRIFKIFAPKEVYPRG